MRLLKLGVLGAACLAVSCATVDKLKPEASGNWYESSRDRKIDLPEFAYVEGPFTGEIVRKYDGKKEIELMRIAESIYPKREVVLAAKRDEHFEPPEEDSAREGLWWYASYKGIRIPYAITTAAVKYYSDLVESFKAGDFSATGGVAITKAQMRYVSVIDHHKWFAFQGRSFGECYVITMGLTWVQYAGQTSAMVFAKKRLVVLDPHGKVLGVFMDGPTNVAATLGEPNAQEKEPAAEGAAPAAKESPPAEGPTTKESQPAEPAPVK